MRLPCHIAIIQCWEKVIRNHSNTCLFALLIYLLYILVHPDGVSLIVQAKIVFHKELFSLLMLTNLDQLQSAGQADRRAGNSAPA